MAIFPNVPFSREREYSRWLNKLPKLYLFFAQFFFLAKKKYSSLWSSFIRVRWVETVLARNCYVIKALLSRSRICFTIVDVGYLIDIWLQMNQLWIEPASFDVCEVCGCYRYYNLKNVHTINQTHTLFQYSFSVSLGFLCSVREFYSNSIRVCLFKSAPMMMNKLPHKLIFLSL